EHDAIQLLGPSGRIGALRRQRRPADRDDADRQALPGSFDLSGRRRVRGPSLTISKRPIKVLKRRVFMSASPNIARRSAFASLIGTCIELYDFYIYATAAAIVFSKLFFPTYDPVVGTLLSFATFAIGAIMRPLGGMVCGHFGDRIGRKSMLVFTLVTMGVSTFAIGLLPTYYQVGILAPIMLVVLRMVQGFTFGGEW